jgi:protein Tex
MVRVETLVAASEFCEHRQPMDDQDNTAGRIIAAELGVRPAQVDAVARLLDEGGTVPFISRYRKEATGSLDEVAVATIRDRLAQLAELEKRRRSIVSSLAERELLTTELEAALRAAPTLSVLEDLYLPYRPKRRTRATIARERGLEPLARRLFAQEPDDRVDPNDAARAYVDADLGVPTIDDALAGGRDIIAEWVSEDAAARAELRALFARRGVLRSQMARGKESEGAKFRDYFDWQEPAAEAPSHRVLAMFRGETEGFLRVRLTVPEADAFSALEARFVRAGGAQGDQVRAAVRDGYQRLLEPSIETECRAETTVRADTEAIRVFAANLRELLLAPTLGPKVVLAIDPGFRTGCKTTVLDAQGRLLHYETIQPHQSERLRREAGDRVATLVTEFAVEAVAIGNGTAGRDTETFVRGLDLPGDVSIVMVNESGASVYSASDVARAELPDQDLTVRGAVSIGRRLQDPLAELVKIDPKSIGVGQYQHDVDQARLRHGLDDVVMSAVNSVGVEVNSASPSLLRYVSGLGPQLATNLVAYRDEHGPFASRKELQKVPRLGPRAFEQAAGFLRIRGAANPLDATAVHPESYPVVQAMAKDLAATAADLLGSAELRRRIEPQRYVSGTVGLPTITDIITELEKPGRDPRDRFEAFSFAADVTTMDDLEPGQRLPGLVTNVTAFGAFVDVGVHQDGLVHVSQLADRFVRDPAEVVRVGQRVTVTVLEVDHQRHRISLSMRERLAPPNR